MLQIVRLVDDQQIEVRHDGIDRACEGVLESPFVPQVKQVRWQPWELREHFVPKVDPLGRLSGEGQAETGHAKQKVPVRIDGCFADEL